MHPTDPKPILPVTEPPEQQQRSSEQRAVGGSSGSESGGYKARAEERKEQLKHSAGEQAEKLKLRAESAIEGQKERIADQIHGVADAIRRTGDALREEDQGALSNVTGQLGERADRAAEYLRGHSSRELLSEVERFARRQPSIFIGAAFSLGLAAARFLKSAQRDEGEGYEEEVRFGEGESPLTRSEPGFDVSTGSSYQEGSSVPVPPSTPPESYTSARPGTPATSPVETGSSGSTAGWERTPLNYPSEAKEGQK